MIHAVNRAVVGIVDRDRRGMAANFHNGAAILCRRRIVIIDAAQLVQAVFRIVLMAAEI